jgi:hypothetical protein
MEAKLIQIVPALRGWGLMIHADDTTQEVACWGLYDDGVVRPLIAGDHCLIVGDLKDSLLEPDAAWNYRVTDRPIDSANAEAPPDEMDWEAVAISKDDDQLSILWRTHRRYTEKM